MPPPKTAPSRTWESWIGRNWASWIGALLLVLGTTFFLKYAWDQGWINPSPAARLASAVGLGLAVGLAGEWVHRKGMRMLAGACYGSSVAIAMASFFGAHVIFDPALRPLSAGGTFAAVALVALAGIALALRVGMQVPGVIALIGAYVAPFILRTGTDNSAALLTYLLVLSLVAWALNALRPSWHAVRSLAFGGTWLSFLGWYLAMRGRHDALALGFAAAYFVGFLGEMIYASRVDSPLRRPLAVLSLLNTACAFLVTWWVLPDATPAGMRLLGCVAVGLALVHAGVVAVSNSRPLKFSSLLQAAALVTLAVPIALDQFFITLAWGAMALAVCAIAWALDVRAARPWAIALWTLALLRLLLIDSVSPTLRGVIVSLGNWHATRWLLAAWGLAALAHAIGYLRPGGVRAFGRLGEWFGLEPEPTLGRAGTEFSATGLLSYARPADSTHTLSRVDRAGAAMAALGTLLFIFASMSHGLFRAEFTLPVAALGVVLALLSGVVTSLGYRTQAATLLLVMTAKWVLGDAVFPAVDQWRSPSFGQSLPLLNPVAIAGLVLLSGALVLWQQCRKDAVRRLGLMEVTPANLATWVLTIAFLLLNVEACRAVDHFAGSAQTVVKQVTLSVLWALIGFAGVLVGFGRKIAALRYTALTLLGVTLLKIMIVDMAEVRAIWRILSFLALGVMLLGVSYLYHRQDEREAIVA